MVKLFDIFPVKLKQEVLEYHLVKNKYNNNNKLRSKSFAFTRVKKLPLDTEKQVISAMNHFNNVAKVTEEEKVEAFYKINKAAEIFKLCTMGFKDRNSKYCL